MSTVATSLAGDDFPGENGLLAVEEPSSRELLPRRNQAGQQSQVPPWNLFDAKVLLHRVTLVPDEHVERGQFA